MTSKQPSDRSFFLGALSLTPRIRDAHKGTSGRLFILGGSVGMSGAPRLVARAADRVGAGLIQVGVPLGIRGELAASLPEALVLPLAETTRGHVSFAALASVLEGAASADALVVGPGLGVSEDLSALVLRLVERVSCPVVVDADALRPAILALCRARSGSTVLTPHPGEAARLLGISVAEVQQDRPGTVQRLARLSMGTVVLKGAGTLVAAPPGAGGAVYENSSGNAGLARGGTGDVLAGMIGGLLVQGVSCADAAILAVNLHGRASDRARLEVGERAQTLDCLLHAVGFEVAALEAGSSDGVTSPSAAPRA